MTATVDHIAGHTYHGRKGGIENAFRYSVDFVMLDAEAPRLRVPRILSRNRGNLLSVQDRDHGGAPGKGRGAAWVRDVLRAYQVHAPGRLLLLAQPRVLGHVFNPVSFWLAHDARDRLIAVISEVTNTFGDRHSYLSVKSDRSPITGQDRLTAQKIFYVSPFQPVEGGYEFQFSIKPDRIGIRIDYGHDKGGLVATLTGPRRPATTLGLLGAMIRRPLGARRVLALIHWQALKLWWKGATYRPRPEPPARDTSP